jgi:uncharacterized protein (DUF427 family)
MNKLSRVEPGPGQESVWDFPRPQWLEKVSEPLRVVFAGENVARTERGFRVLETSHPPVYYIPPGDVRQDFLIEGGGQSFCEFKGVAKYWSLVTGHWSLDVDGKQSAKAAWSCRMPFGATWQSLAWWRRSGVSVCKG